MSDPRRYDLDPDPRSRSRSRDSESLEIDHFQNLSPPRGLTESIGGLDIMSLWDILQSVTEPEFSISSQGLRHVTPNLGYLAKTTKFKVYFLEHGLRYFDETWYMDRSQWPIHDGITVTPIQGQGQGHGTWEFAKYGESCNTCLTQNLSRPRGLMESMECLDIISLWDILQSVTEPEFSISPQGLRHVTPNLHYLAKTAKFKVHFLGHGLRYMLMKLGIWI
jgi:hypothetical protein